MKYHFVLGEEAATPIMEAISLDEQLQGNVCVLKDQLNIGPLSKAEEDASFADTRNNYWKSLKQNDKNELTIEDLALVLDASKELFADEQAQAWFWMAPTAANICAYYWLLSYFQKHPNRFYIINIAGLPFLNTEGKVFYPKSFAEVSAKEIIKAKKLARPVTPSEIEMDTEEWKKIVAEEAPIRFHDGGKKIIQKPANHYDSLLTNTCTTQFQKAHKVIQNIISKNILQVGEAYLMGRIRILNEQHQLIIQGDASKSARDFEIKLPGEAIPLL
jgi:hypothetical protein